MKVRLKNLDGLKYNNNMEPRDIENIIAEEDFRNQLRENRLKEQNDKKDYSYKHDGGIETCDDCRTPINSHGHCPTCDY